MVVRETEDGSLVVRQASEVSARAVQVPGSHADRPSDGMPFLSPQQNTGDILGLSPSYLFSLPTFLDCLEEDQADVLWDALESLDDREDELLESGPHVFQISGFGQPGPGIGKARARMHWQCWCAAHRSLKGANADSSKGHMTILEFEPMHDIRFPLMTHSAPSSPAHEQTEEEAMTPPVSGKPQSGYTVFTDNSESGESVDTKLSMQFGSSATIRGGLDGMPYVPTVEQLRESTTSTSKPIKALSRMRRKNGEQSEKRARPRRTGGAAGPGLGGSHTAGEDAMLDMFGILTQINEQFSAQEDLPSFLKMVVSVVRDLTNFSRVMIYQFDDQWNGQVVCELVDINDTHDLYRGLNFPATDIPKQARDLYRINKVRLLYDRDLPSARMVCREKVDLDTPVDMTHSFLRAMSPIHVKYLENMGVRASMSCSIMAFNQLWGLISLHTYGAHGRRVSFPMRQLLRLVSESVSHNIERLSYTKRLQSRKLINTLPTSGAPSGYILTKAEELLDLFDADIGVIAIGSECKILGSVSASQEVLALTEWLRLKKFSGIVHTSNTAEDWPDMELPEGIDLSNLAGVLCIPLSEGSKDFIVFIRRAQTRTVSWAGKPFKEGKEAKATLEPRKSFKLWKETVHGTCRAWKDEELETASVLCLVYGKFISVWRSREAAMQYNQLNRLLLSNASHEVRTPLHHLVSYLEMALDGPLDAETRENLTRGRIASKSLLFTINDLLDISRAEQGKQLFLQEPFDLAESVREAVEMHEWEAKRRKISFKVVTKPSSCVILGDKNRLRQVIVNTTSNSLRHTPEGGSIYIEMLRRKKDKAVLQLPEDCDVEMELSISDTGCGIPREKLEAIFREFEQVESVVPSDDTLAGRRASDNVEESLLLGPEGPPLDKTPSSSGLGVGLAVVARIVRNLQGQLRVDSTVGVGSRFTYLIPFKQADVSELTSAPSTVDDIVGPQRMSRSSSQGTLDRGSSGGNSELDSLVEAIGAPSRSASERGALLTSGSRGAGPRAASALGPTRHDHDGYVEVAGSRIPLRPTKVDAHSMDTGSNHSGDNASTSAHVRSPPTGSVTSESHASATFTASDGASSRRSGAPSARRSQNKTTASVREKVGPLRVLVVEDDPINRMILKKRLGIDGHTVHQAMNGEEGVHKFETQTKDIDLILMDLQMPICNGQDACKRIRSLEAQRGEAGRTPELPAIQQTNGRVPIFAVSATLTPSMREEMTQIGMDGWILKPVDFSRLAILLKGTRDLAMRRQELWMPGKDWEKGGWLCPPPASSKSAGSKRESTSEPSRRGSV